MRFGLLGPVAVWTADGDPVPVPERKVRLLLAVLLVHRGFPVSTERLIDHLWGAAPPPGVTNTLQTKVSQLRRVLEAARAGGRHLLQFGAAGYVLRVEPEALDTERFAALVAAARTVPEPADRADRLAKALQLWRADALAGVRDHPFARAAADRLDEERLVVVEERMEARLEAGEHATLAGELSDLVARHPLRERLRAAHMRSLYQAGRQDEALGSYRDLRERLTDELGIEPGLTVVALHQAMLERDPGLEPTRAQPSVRRSNLPVPLTDLVGRESALDEVGTLLQTSRLVTFTGAGGVGKTRLAVAAATAAMDDQQSDEVWFVELGGVPPPSRAERSDSANEQVAELVATVLGVRDTQVRAATAARAPGAG